ncbi:hypothetical protein G9F71_008415 [Clostridium sp. FP2]|uniref:hypothetical protein n=1 Tax=Clostridium sp. FP2 TaxID=2724481 RepID=UPI0013E98EE5|nr:hypothetical protein [Clostridium sp. FP2]MBZ9622875.1 hypothetical protein [Clostridium sp. FP2]
MYYKSVIITNQLGIYYNNTEEMLIPKVIGCIKRGFNQALLHIKLLPLGGRYRGDVRV